MEKKNGNGSSMEDLRQLLEMEAGGPMPTTEKKPGLRGKTEADEKAEEIILEAQRRLAELGHDMFIGASCHGPRYCNNNEDDPAISLFMINGMAGWVIENAIRMLEGITGIKIHAVVSLIDRDSGRIAVIPVSALEDLAAQQLRKNEDCGGEN